jgi:omega-hydroxy-beta-dihydromenaquinone-9 sulfotransferase
VRDLFARLAKASAGPVSRCEIRPYSPPAGRFHEIGFEQLEQDPIGEVRKIYETLSLPPFSEVEPALRQYMNSLAGYRKNAFPDLSVELMARMAKEWKMCFEKWGYSTGKDATAG